MALAGLGQIQGCVDARVVERSVPFEVDLGSDQTADVGGADVLELYVDAEVVDAMFDVDTSPMVGHVRGEVSFEDPYWDEGVAFQRRPCTMALVEVLAQREVVGSGYTDDLGRFALNFEPGSGEHYVRVVASRSVPGEDVAVVDAQRRVYAVRPLDGFRAHETPYVVLALGDGPSVSAPFNALDAITTGLAWWQTEVGPLGHIPLHVVWQEGENFGCGTCYQDADVPKTIYLYGIPNDNDALDDPVILHELGHFLQTNYSHDDSPQGSHDGTPTDPRLAWAEGWATAFSSMVRGDAGWFDTRGSSRTFVDLEMPDPDYGTFTGDELSDPVSEYLVASLLFDLWDEVDDGADVLSLGAGVVRPLVDHLAGGEVEIRGAAGVDLVDYLDGTHCLELANPADLDARLAQSLFPYDARDAACRKPSPPLTLGEGFVVAHRPFDSLQVRVCRHARSCTAVVKVGPVASGQLLKFDVEGPVEVVARRGSMSWVAYGESEVAPTVRSKWKPSTPTHDGRAVVEQIAQ